MKTAQEMQQINGGTPKAYPPSICPGIPKLGKCPAGWKRRSFGEVLKVVERPAALEDDKEYQLVNARRSRGGIVPRERLRGQDIKTKSQYRVKAGDFLIANRQIIHGGCGVVPPMLDGALVSGEYTVLQPRDGLSLPWFAYFAHTPYFQQTCFHSSIGVDVEKMVFKLDWWLKHELDTPPTSEQERIAELLATWDAAIDQTQKLIEAKKCLKKGLVQELLGGAQRAAPHSAAWRRCCIGDLVTINPDSLSEATDPSFAFLYIDLSAVDEGKIKLPASVLKFRDAPSRARRLFLKGDILMASVRPSLAGYARVMFETEHHVCSTGFAVLRPKSGVSGEFVYQLLFSPSVQSQLVAIVTGSSYPAVNEDEVASLRVSIPSSEKEQESIASILQTADTEIAAYEGKLTALQDQKRGLMQKLLTGEIRMSRKS